MRVFDEVPLFIASIFLGFFVVAKLQTIAVWVCLVFRFVANEGFNHRDRSGVERTLGSTDLANDGIHFGNGN